jgi:parallel beta-helix repeat protein
MLPALTSACSSHHASSSGEPPDTTARAARPRSRHAQTTFPAARGDGQGRSHAIPRSIASDCSTDVTAELQSWFDQLPDHVTAELRTDGCYRVEGTVELAERRNFVLDGNGATLKATTVGAGGRLAVRQRSQLNIVGSDDVTVRNLIVRGANPHAGIAAAAYQPDLEAQHAFSLHGDDGVILDRVQAYDVYGDFVYIGGMGRTPSRHITVENSRFARNGRQGISITNSDDIVITGNDIRDVRRSLFDLEPNRRADEARHVRIDDNVTGRAVNYWLADKGSGVNIGDVTVSRNVMQEPTGALVIVYGPASGRRGPFTFVDNTFRTTGAVSDENAAGAFLFAYASGIRLDGNVVRVPPARRLVGVELRSAADVVIVDNRFVGATKPLLADAASRRVLVTPPAASPATGTTPMTRRA